MKATKLMTLMLALAFAVGCSNKSEDNTAATPVTPIVPGLPDGPDTGTGGSSVSGTNTVDFMPVSFEEFNSYVATRPLNNPTNFKLTVDLTETGGRYHGTVKITYNDNGQTWGTTGFSSGSGTNADLSSSDGLFDYHKDDFAGIPEYAYNVWFNHSGKYVFSGFFQDQIGSIVLVVDDVVNQADAQGGSFVSGSIYYRNFAQTTAPMSPHRKCWFITVGPYNCGSSAVIYKNAIYPTDNGYRKLGTFGGLLKSKAFHP